MNRIQEKLLRKVATRSFDHIASSSSDSDWHDGTIVDMVIDILEEELSFLGLFELSGFEIDVVDIFDEQHDFHASDILDISENTDREDPIYIVKIVEYPEAILLDKATGDKILKTIERAKHGAELPESEGVNPRKD